MKTKLMDDIRMASRVIRRHEDGGIVARAELLDAIQQLNQASRQLDVLQFAETVSFGDEEIDGLLQKLGE